MKIVIITLSLIFLTSLEAKCPCFRIERLYVRLTAYSPKQPGEGHICANGKDARNERGIALPKALAKELGLNFGDKVVLPNGEIRIYDDSYPTGIAKRKFNNQVMDVRWHESIRSRPKTKAVNRELCNKFDMGKDYVEIYYNN